MMFSTYTEEYNQISQYAQEEVQRWADRFVGHTVRICRESGSILANDKVVKAEAKGLDVKFSFEGGMWCTLPACQGYTITMQ
jgi:hypothetical protein